MAEYDIDLDKLEVDFESFIPPIPTLEHLAELEVDDKLVELIKHIKETGEAPEEYELNVPEGYPAFMRNSFLCGMRHSILVRDYFTHNISWCLVEKRWCRKLLELIGDSEVIELYAGRGLITKTLRDLGCKNITAYDNMSWFSDNDLFTEVIDNDVISVCNNIKNDKIKKPDYIIMSWIPYEDETINTVIDILKEAVPDVTIICIGEGWGGCTATDYFFENTYEVGFIEIPQFYGVHDACYILKLKKG